MTLYRYKTFLFYLFQAHKLFRSGISYSCFWWIYRFYTVHYDLCPWSITILTVNNILMITIRSMWDEAGKKTWISGKTHYKNGIDQDVSNDSGFVPSDSVTRTCETGRQAFMTVTRLSQAIGHYLHVPQTPATHYYTPSTGDQRGNSPIVI